MWAGRRVAVEQGEATKGPFISKRSHEAMMPASYKESRAAPRHGQRHLREIHVRPLRNAVRRRIGRPSCPTSVGEVSSMETAAPVSPGYRHPTPIGGHERR